MLGNASVLPYVIIGWGLCDEAVQNSRSSLTVLSILLALFSSDNKSLLTKYTQFKSTHKARKQLLKQS